MQMSDGNFAEYISRERDRLNAEREAIIIQRRELDQRLAEINREFHAVDAYEAAKRGKGSTRQAGARKPSGVRQARRGSRREELMNIIRQGHGLTRGEILEKMGLKGNKSGEMSVSNALTALTKSNQVRRNEERKYVAA
jgi:hypothetical protein